jgi:phenylacetate-CoA ligase
MKITERLFGKIIIPLAYYFKGDFRYYYYKKYKKNLKLSNDEIKKYQLIRLQKLIHHAYDTVPYYTKLFDEMKLKPEDIKTLNDIKKIPLLDKKTILKNLDQLKSNKKYKLEECVSGGSSGNPVTVFKDKRYYEISRAVWMRDFSTIGFQPGEKSAWLWGSDLEIQPLKKLLRNRILWWINRRILFNTFRFNEQDLEKWLLNDFNKFKPDFILGYASSLYQIAKYIKDKKLKIHQVKKIISTAEKIQNRDFIEEVFNCKVVDHYGCREVITIAIEDENCIMHSSDDFLFVEIGKNNQILLTPLESYGMPLLRYVNGDIGLKKNNQEKGNNQFLFEEFNLSIGRMTEYLYTKDNEILMGAIIGHTAAEQKLVIGEFQIVQKTIGNIEIKIVKNSNTNNEDINKLKKIIVNLLGETKIFINYVNEYPLEMSGKKLNYKCLIKNENFNNKL